MHTHSPIPRTALVTGGSSGIGLAIARRLRQQGYRIALVARDSQRLQRAAAELGGVPWMAADLSRREAVEAVAAWVGDTFQGLDVLVNNAGFTRKIAAATPLAEAEREWDALLDGNLKSAFLMSLAVLPHFAEEGGRIIHIGSIAAQTGSGSPGALGYAAAKAGLHGFGVALARELGSRGITVNNVQPGPVDTDMNPDDGDFAEALKGLMALPRYARSEEIASFVAYLAGPEAAYITGASLTIDGGFSA
ncbi:SDR family oxidoreductase [Pseudomonas aeruginosa]|nr:SDR family oxidoreductase [Pseudomonas aeruginosa]MBF3272625.1 SDR family oxidoreductase [Pseudomonas aeruginosa]MBF3287366.1 SDR family oxidoreductase [Pseudomonas aeruginosa]